MYFTTYCNRFHKKGRFQRCYFANLIIKFNIPFKKRIKVLNISTMIMLSIKNRKTSLVINTKEAKVVEYIFDSCLAGNGLRAIANDLNNKGHTTKRGNRFFTIVVRDILGNRVYRGDIIYGKKLKSLKNYKAILSWLKVYMKLLSILKRGIRLLNSASYVHRIQRKAVQELIS